MLSWLAVSPGIIRPIHAVSVLVSETVQESSSRSCHNGNNDTSSLQSGLPVLAAARVATVLFTSVTGSHFIPLLL